MQNSPISRAAPHPAKDLLAQATEDLAGRRVLVTGSAGYVGSRVVEWLRGAAVATRTVDILNPGDSQDLRYNLRESGPTAELLDGYLPDLVIHCGTHSALRYRDDFMNAVEEDAAALINLMRSLRERPEARLLYFSSSYVYSGAAGTGALGEDSVLQPSHNFGVAKRFFEELLRRTLANAVVFRLASVFGRGNCQHPNSVHAMTDEARRDGKIVVWGEGKRRIQYTYMDDVLRCVLAADRVAPGVYNVGARSHVSVAEAARQIAETVGCRVVFEPDRREGETLPLMDTAKLEGALDGFHFEPFEVSLRRYLQATGGKDE